jgi:hypothetical protein
LGKNFPISQSSEKLPGPNARTVKVISKNGNGAAWINLSESVKMVRDHDCVSPVELGRIWFDWV